MPWPGRLTATACRHRLARSASLAPARSGARRSLSVLANRQLRTWPSAVSRTRSQLPQNGRATDAITPTRAGPPSTRHASAGAEPPLPGSSGVRLKPRPRAARNSSAVALSARLQPRCALQGAMQFNLGAKDGEQPFVFPGLLNEIPRPAAHSLDCKVNTGPRGHHNYRSATLETHDVRKKVEAFLPGGRVARIVQIDEQGIVGTRGQRIANQRRGSRGFHIVSLRTQEEFKGFEDMLLVVRRQDARSFVLVLRRSNGEMSSGFGGSLHKSYGLAALTVSPTTPVTAF